MPHSGVSLDLQESRVAKLARLRQHAIDPYPHRFDRTDTISQIRGRFAGLAAGKETEERVRVAGRIVAKRDMGRVSFFDLQDLSGKIQLYARAEGLSTRYQLLTACLDIGDILGIEGTVFRTRRGELSIKVEHFEFLSKCLQPLPDKRHGLQDIGTIRDQRYLELIIDPQARKRFLMRSQIISALRHLLEEKGFIEVETPTLDTIYGGAEARPFTTHCWALDNELFLRISPELPLKRLIVGGLEKIFEIGKQFRNEGIDRYHHPEFTSIEIYQAYADYNDMMALTEEIFSRLAEAVINSRKVASHLRDDEIEIDLTPPFRRLTLLDAIKMHTGCDLSLVDDTKARQLASELRVNVSADATADEVIMAIFDAKVQERLIQPTFILDYPASICPLTKRHRSNPRLAERFELFIHGLEFANAYSELSDPAEQRRHFEHQAGKRVRGDEAAHLPDYDFVRALEYGMPPTGGLGIGIDRLVMLLTGTKHIQDVILFPMRTGRSQNDGM